MSDTVKLTMEVEVPRDQLPEGYTGRLVCRKPTNDDFTIVITADGMAVMKVFAGVEFSSPRIIVEVRQPWRVPDYLRHERFSGWQIAKSNYGVIVFVPKDGKRNIEVTADENTLALLGGKWSDFDDMKNDVYKIGEDAE